MLQIEHERVWDWQHFTHAQLKVVTQQRQRDYEELLARALVTLQEAKHAHQEELELHRDRQHQQDICSHLKKKVSAWCAITIRNISNFMKQLFYVSNYVTVLCLQSIFTPCRKWIYNFNIMLLHCSEAF